MKILYYLYTSNQTNNPMKTKSFIKVFGFISLFMLSYNTFCQPPDSLWQYHLGGAGDDLGFDVIESTNAGEYILVGKTKSFGNGMFDGYVMKLDNSGAKVWEKYYGGAYDEQLLSICPAHTGGYVATGFIKSIPGERTAVWVQFIDEQGDSVLSKTFNTQYDCWGLHISPTNSQGYAVSAVMSAGFGAGDEIWLFKLNTVGDTIWTHAYGRANQDYGEQVIQTSDGGYIIAGRTYSSYTPESCDAWVIKTDASGDSLWTRMYGGDNEDMFNCVIETDDGYIFAGNAESFGSGYAEFWAVRTDDNGDTIWSRTDGDDVQHLCFEIFETGEGNYVLAGYSGLLTPSFDTYLMEIDPDGNMIWEARSGHAQANEIMYGFSPTFDGGYIATGHTTYYTAYKDELVALKLGPAGSGISGNYTSGEEWLKIFPNPVYGQTSIRFYNPVSGMVRLMLLNLMGIPVRTLAGAEMTSGWHEIVFDSGDLAGGIYFLRYSYASGEATFQFLISK